MSTELPPDGGDHRPSEAQRPLAGPAFSRAGTGPGLPPPEPPAWRPLRARDGVLGGVCRGFAEATGVDLTLVRLAFVAAGLSGFGVLAYLVLWLVVPREDAGAGRVLVPAPPDTARWLRLGLLVGGLVGLVSFAWRWSFGWFDPFPWHGPTGRGPGLFIGLLLVAVGVGVIWFRRREEVRASRWRNGRTGLGVSDAMPDTSTAVTSPPASSTPGASPASTATAGTSPPVSTTAASPASAPATPWPAPVSEDQPGGPTPPSAGLPTAAMAPPPPPRPRLSGWVVALRVIAWLAVIGAILLTALAGVLTFVVGALSVTLPGLALVAMVAAIIGVVVAATTARTVWPLLLALVLLVGAMGLSAGLAHWDGKVGKQVLRPQTVAELQPTYDFAAGHLVLDLSQVSIAEGSVPIAIDQGVGRLDVVVPQDAVVRADVEVLGGEANIFDTSDDGGGIDLAVVDTPADPAGQLDLRIELGFGQANVCRAQPGVPVLDGCPG